MVHYQRVADTNQSQRPAAQTRTAVPEQTARAAAAFQHLNHCESLPMTLRRISVVTELVDAMVLATL
jgi:hypothetical protein